MKPRTPSILFVCSGNICRSPMAEALAVDILHSQGIYPKSCKSAGTLRMEGVPAAEETVNALREIGLNLDAHRSKGVTSSLLRQSDLVVVMEPEHVLQLHGVSPDVLPKIVRLWEYTTKYGSLAKINDPIGKDKHHYIRCREDIMECLQNWASKLAKE